MTRQRHSVLSCMIAVVFGPAAALAQGVPGSDIFLVSVDEKNGVLEFGKPANITDRDGYDNQPSFTPDGRSILYTSNREGQTDIYRYYIRTGATRQVTQTRPESEYSPAVIPSGNAFSVVRVESDSTQRLWQFGIDGGSPRVVLTQVKPVGYYAWGNDHMLGVFVLADSAIPLSTLRLADTRSGRATIVAYNVGRSLHKVPGRNAISFTHRLPELWIKEIDLDSRAVTPMIELLEGNEFYTWLPDGTALTARESTLFRWDPAGEAEWQAIADFAESGVTGISRLAASPGGDWLAMVGTRNR
ncbi:MAG: PD40 domain-containing protein [Gemmatimonadota bacterium]|nr:MAG: PD40 domain-containing protein [Gemmatimonadota bacterium]